MKREEWTGWTGWTDKHGQARMNRDKCRIMRFLGRIGIWRDHEGGGPCGMVQQVIWKRPAVEGVRLLKILMASGVGHKMTSTPFFSKYSVASSER